MLLAIVIVLAAISLAGAVILWNVLTRRTVDLDATRASLATQGQQIARLEADNQHFQRAAQHATETLQRADAEKSQLRDQAILLQTQIAELTTALDHERSNSKEKLDLLTGARKELSDQFEVLASKILEDKSRRFTEQNQTNLDALIAPLKEKFGEFQQKVADLRDEGLTGRTELKSQLEQLRLLNTRLSEDATNLVSALRGSSKAQGDWGEVVLERILESSGLRKGNEYRMQESITREDRTRARLDVILDLPEDRHLVLDSKVSLNDYSDYCSVSDDAAREAALGRHLASMRNHIRDLSRRNYQSLYGLNSLDFVVMFVPIEPAFMLALARDGKLWQEAWDRNILLVSPSTLLFVLRTVAHLWRQEQQKRDVQNIVKRGRELYDKLAAFAKDLVDVGKSLDDAKASYDEAYKKLAEGRGNVIRQAEMLKNYGVTPTKTLPSAMVDLAMAGEPGDLFEEPSGETEIPFTLNPSPDSATADRTND